MVETVLKIGTFLTRNGDRIVVEYYSMCICEPGSVFVYLLPLYIDE
mgnify:CR=1 FL=1